MTRTDQLARVCKVLSVPTRLRILQLLKGRALCVNALAARLDVTQGAVSQHLRILRDAGLLEAQKRGYYVHYRLNGKSLAKCQAVLDQFLGAGPSRLSKRSHPCAKERTKRCAAKSQSARSRNN